MNNETVLIGGSKFISKLRNDLPKLARQQKNMLLFGEKGVGKTTIARLAHQLSSKGKLVVLHSTISGDHEIKKSLDTQAGAVLVQDVELFSFLHQSLIFKALQENKSSTRFFVTARRQASKLLRERKLLPELHDALQKFEAIEVPPLSERTDDIPLLAEYFIKNACESAGTELKTIDINSIDFLTKRPYPDNIVELKNLIEKAVFSSKGDIVEIQGIEMDAELQLDGILKNITKKQPFSITRSLDMLEKALILKTLKATAGNQTRAAKLLNLGGSHFRYRLRKFNIKRNQ